MLRASDNNTGNEDNGIKTPLFVRSRGLWFNLVSAVFILSKLVYGLIPCDSVAGEIKKNRVVYYYESSIGFTGEHLADRFVEWSILMYCHINNEPSPFFLLRIDQRYFWKKRWSSRKVDLDSVARIAKYCFDNFTISFSSCHVLYVYLDL